MKYALAVMAGIFSILAYTLFCGNVYASTKSDIINSDNVQITNNVNKSDKIYIYGLSPKETIRVYADETGARQLASKTLGQSATSVTFTVSQLGVESGFIYITSTLSGYDESERVKVEYDAEPISEKLTESNINIENNADSKDVITVSDLMSADVVSIYQDKNKNKRITTARVGGSKTTAALTYSQLGANGGVIYMTVTSTGKRESEILAVEFPAEAKASPLSAGDIEITNKKGTGDKIVVSGAEYGDSIIIYENMTTAKKLATAKCARNKTEITKVISSLKKDGGSIYIALKQTNKQESERIKVDYAAESVTEAINASQVSIANNPKGTQDVIEVEGLESGVKVKVYKLENSTAAIKSATCSSSSDTVTMKLSQLGSDAGVVWISVTESDMHESVRIPVIYDSENISEVIDASNVTVVNNYGTSDSIRISELNEGEIIKIYKTAAIKTTLATKTASSSDAITVITLSQLGTAAGSVYITVTRDGCNESERVEIAYPAEGKSMTPNTDNITVVNNTAKASVMTVTGLTEEDVVSVYKNSTDINAIGTATVAQYQTETEVSLSSLNADGGTVYVTVRSENLKESDKAKVTYGAQESTEAVKLSKVTVVNNADLADTITVSERDAGDVINVYNQETGGKLLSSATVASGSIKAVVTVTQLGEEGGTVYISAKNSGLKESARIAVSFDAEQVTEPLLAGNVEILNYSGKSDTITVYGLMPGNTVKVYTNKTIAAPLVSADVSGTGATLTLSVSQLGVNAGSVYISVTKSGYKESERVEIAYNAESAALESSAVSVVNNASISDTVTVSSLAVGDMVTVYATSSSAAVLASQTSSNGGTVTLTIDQLGSSAGNIYVTVTNKNRAESQRTAVSYLAEQSTLPLFIGQVTITNNIDVSDIIQVKELSPYDTIRIYSLASGGDLLGSGSVGSSQNSVSISVKQLGENAGKVYITITSYGKTESTRLCVDYTSE